MKTIIHSLLLCALLTVSTATLGYHPEKAGFTVEINGETNPYSTYSTFVLPGAGCSVSSGAAIVLTSNHLNLPPSPSRQWKFTAPTQPGVYSLEIKQADRSMHINLLVLTPLSDKKGEYLNGYRIGNYPATPLNGNPIYNKPKGFFEVTKENQHMLLTPHFRVSQFVCKQNDDFPKYIIVRERLLLKLEYLLEKVNNNGYSIETFGFISGYRTPYYNKLINNVPYSRHVYGGAADIYISQNQSGDMDDLNQDGVVDEKDVRIFYNIVELEFDKPSYDKYRGGLGFYRKNTRHNGFIHVDVRGWKARW